MVNLPENGFEAEEKFVSQGGLNKVPKGEYLQSHGEYLQSHGGASPHNEHASFLDGGHSTDEDEDQLPWLEEDFLNTLDASLDPEMTEACKKLDEPVLPEVPRYYDHGFDKENMANVDQFERPAPVETSPPKVYIRADSSLSDRPLYVPTDGAELAESPSIKSEVGGSGRAIRAGTADSLIDDVLSMSYQQEQKVSLRLTTTFHSKYWRNDRKNLQCFPYCQEFKDYYLVRLHKFEHREKGNCAATITARLEGYNDEEVVSLVALGRFSLSCQEDEQGEFNAGNLVSSEDFEALKGDCIVGKLRNDSPRQLGCSLEFSQTLWKVGLVLSKKRRPVNNPSKIPHYVFEVIVFSQTKGGFKVVARTTSTKFQIASTRTLIRELQNLPTGAGFHQYVEGLKRKVDMAMPDEKIRIVDEKRTRIEVLAQNSVKKESVQLPVANKAQSTVKEEALQVKDEPKSNISQTAAGEGASHDQSKNPDHIAPTEARTRQQVEKSGDDTSEGAGSNLQFGAESLVQATKRAEAEARASRSEMIMDNPGLDTSDMPIAVGQGPSVLNVQDRVVASDPSNEVQGLELSLTQMYIVTLFGGIFGVHRFLLNERWWGTFYACTLGGFLIGYLVDLVRLPMLYEKGNSHLIKLSRDPYYQEPSILGLCDAYILTIVSGVFGGHHFYMGNSKRGYLYLFTLGLLAFGWLYDLVTLSGQVQQYNAKERDRFNLQHADRDLEGMEMTAPEATGTR